MDIIIGAARLYFVEQRNRKGWIVHGGYLIYEKDKAIEYAKRVNQILQGK